MSTGMRKWMEKDCPEIEYPPAHRLAQVLIDREELKQLLYRLKATEEDRSNFLVEMGKLCAQCDALRAKVEAMERQEPVAFALYSGWARKAVYLSEIEACEQRDRRQLTADLGGSLEAYRVAPLYLAPGAQPAPSVPECPYPCGWQNLLKHAIEDGAYLARSINEDEPVTENARAVVMRMVMRLRDVLMAINNAAPDAKP